jgi:DNA polymerase III epsilon subunit-like protein
VWFDDVDVEELEGRTASSSTDVGKKKKSLVTGHITEPTKEIAIDCEMVGTGVTGGSSVLARCSIVNSHGHVLLDKYGRPKERVTDFRTSVSGIRPKNLREAERFEDIQKDVAALLTGRILIGHAVHHDLKVLMLSHPHSDIRDTSKYKLFRQLSRVRLYRGRLVCCHKVLHLYQTTILLRGAKQSICHLLVRYRVLCQGFVLLHIYIRMYSETCLKEHQSKETL